jgi:hypothetical protein
MLPPLLRQQQPWRSIIAPRATPVEALQRGLGRQHAVPPCAGMFVTDHRDSTLLPVIRFAIAEGTRFHLDVGCCGGASQRAAVPFTTCDPLNPNRSGLYISSIFVGGAVAVPAARTRAR